MEGLLLFAHGARDVRWAEPFKHVRALLENSTDTPVGLAYLELMTPNLDTEVARLVNGGCDSIVIVPIFLGQGGHVRSDLPRLVESVRALYPHLRIRSVPAAGEDAEVLGAIASYCKRQVIR